MDKTSIISSQNPIIQFFLLRRFNRKGKKKKIYKYIIHLFIFHIYFNYIYKYIIQENQVVINLKEGKREKKRNPII